MKLASNVYESLAAGRVGDWISESSQIVILRLPGANGSLCCRTGRAISRRPRKHAECTVDRRDRCNGERARPLLSSLCVRVSPQESLEHLKRWRRCVLTARRLVDHSYAQMLCLRCPELKNTDTEASGAGPAASMVDQEIRPQNAKLAAAIVAVDGVLSGDAPSDKARADIDKSLDALTTRGDATGCNYPRPGVRAAGRNELADSYYRRTWSTGRSTAITRRWALLSVEAPRHVPTVDPSWRLTRSSFLALDTPACRGTGPGSFGAASSAVLFRGRGDLAVAECCARLALRLGRTMTPGRKRARPGTRLSRSPGAAASCWPRSSSFSPSRRRPSAGFRRPGRGMAIGAGVALAAAAADELPVDRWPRAVRCR